MSHLLHSRCGAVASEHSLRCAILMLGPGLAHLSSLPGTRPSLERCANPYTQVCRHTSPHSCSCTHHWDNFCHPLGLSLTLLPWQSLHHLVDLMGFSCHVPLMPLTFYSLCDMCIWPLHVVMICAGSWEDGVHIKWCSQRPQHLTWPLPIQWVFSKC